MALLLAQERRFRGEHDALAVALRAQHGVRMVARLKVHIVVPGSGCAMIVADGCEDREDATGGGTGDGGAGDGGAGEREPPEWMGLLGELANFRLGLVLAVGEGALAEVVRRSAQLLDKVHVVFVESEARVFEAVIKAAQDLTGPKLAAAAGWLDAARAEAERTRGKAIVDAIAAHLPIDDGDAYALLDACGSVNALAQLTVDSILSSSPLSLADAMAIVTFLDNDEPVL